MCVNVGVGRRNTPLSRRTTWFSLSSTSIPPPKPNILTHDTSYDSYYFDSPTFAGVEGAEEIEDWKWSGDWEYQEPSFSDFDNFLPTSFWLNCLYHASPAFHHSFLDLLFIGLLPFYFVPILYFALRNRPSFEQLSFVQNRTRGTF
ncbi:hypothetical protein CPC08DRAFT_419455 [Agrocybe pediades]|nr:hypothetical protein CPC08DRAFT_419455 [Agrocybe pediades]